MYPPAAFPGSQPCARFSENHHHLQTLLLTTKHSSHVSIRFGQYREDVQHPKEQKDMFFSDVLEATTMHKIHPAYPQYRIYTLLKWAPTEREMGQILTLALSSPYFRHNAHCLLSSTSGGGFSSGLSSLLLSQP